MSVRRVTQMRNRVTNRTCAWYLFKILSIDLLAVALFVLFQCCKAAVALPLPPSIEQWNSP
jgi:hypothetical protein